MGGAEWWQRKSARWSGAGCHLKAELAAFAEDQLRRFQVMTLLRVAAGGCYSSAQSTQNRPKPAWG